MKNKDYKILKKEILSSNDTFDKWGFCLGLHFELCEYLRYKKLKIPENWGYSAGCGVYSSYAELMAENQNVWIFHTQSYKILIHLGNVLSRYARILKHVGKDY